MKCKNCQTELTQMKNETGENICLRCLKCNPLPVELPDSQKKVVENKKVDVPWTEERIRAIVNDEIENYVIKQNKTDPEPTWQEQAKALGINPYGRKKEIVLAEIAEKTKGPDEPVNNESP